MAFQLDNISTKAEKVSGNSKSLDSLLTKDIIVFRKPFSNKVKEDFYLELSVLLNAGVNLKEALELLAQTVKKKSNKAILQLVSADIVSGLSFSDAIQRRDSFSEYEYFSIRIGEETGTLAMVTEQLGDFFARKNEQRRQLISALTYPMIILGTAVLVVAFMLQFVVPMFQDIFAQQNLELPGITIFIIGLSTAFKTYGWLGILLIVSVPISRSFLNHKHWYRKRKDRFISGLPVVGNFVRTVYLSQFTQAVSLLTASKVPVINSIQLVRQMIAFYPLNRALEAVEQELLKGHSLSASMDGHKLFDSKMIALIKVAEETNQTDFIFQRLNTQYNTQVQQRSKLLSTVMEPMIIVFVGILVGVILIAMYLPMFKLSSALG